VKSLRIKAKTTANNTQPSITRIGGAGRNSGKSPVRGHTAAVRAFGAKKKKK